MPTTIKTSYCKHSVGCDREEDCKAGEYCPFFDARTMEAEPVYDPQEAAEDEFERILRGG